MKPLSPIVGASAKQAEVAEADKPEHQAEGGKNQRAVDRCALQALANYAVQEYEGGEDGKILIPGSGLRG